MKSPSLFQNSIATAALILITPMAHSATLFEFGPSKAYVSQRVAFDRTATPTGSGPYTSTVAYDASTPLSPTDNYTGPTFYGGYSFTSQSLNLGFAAEGQGLIQDYGNTAGNDAIYFNVTGSNNDSFHQTTMSFASLFVFRQAAFNQPFQTGNVSVDGFSISLYRHANGSIASWFKPEGRWLVEINGTYYLSNSVFTGATNDTYATFALSGNDLETTLWATYNPVEDLYFDASSATFNPLALENIAAVGFYIDDPSFQSINGTVGMRLAVDSFTVTTAVPEPASLAFLALGAPFLLRYLAARKGQPLSTR